MNIPDQMTDMTERPRAWWAEAPVLQKGGAIGGGSVLIIGLIVAIFSMGGGDEDWNPAILYASLDYAEAAEVTTRLASLGIQHRLTEDATTIVVPDNEVRNLRLTLAAEGFPRTGHIGYEIFDDNQLAMTEFLQTVSLRRALQGELEKTLNTISGVRNSRVHLVIPEPSLFTEEQHPVTASVTLSLGSGAKLRDRQIEAMVNLISASVEGLDLANVVIVDSEGNMLSEERNPLAKAASRQFEQQQRVERALEEKVQGLLDGIIGKKRSKVRINVVLDFSQRVTRENVIDPGGSQVVLSEETNEKDSAEQGKEENAVRNFEVNRTVRDIVGSVGVVSKMTMALTVDATKVVFDPETGGFVESDRPQQEIDQLSLLAQQAVGFDVPRGDQVTVYALRFDKSQEIQERESAAAEASKEFWTGVALNVAKVLGILAALITLRFIIQAIGRGVGVEEEIEVLGEVAGEVEEEDFERPATPHDLILSRIQQMVRERPEDAAKLLRTMLAEQGAGA